MLNYRYQALTESATLPAFAPRLSVILPTGDEDRGTGFGSYGYQINLPVSKIVSDRVTLHGNAGVTSYFDVHGRQPTSYNLGGSIVYAVTRNTNFLVEALGEWTETVNDTFGIDREFAFTLLPGVRHAFNLKEGQLVLGAGVPIQFTEGRHGRRRPLLPVLRAQVPLTLLHQRDSFARLADVAQPALDALRLRFASFVARCRALVALRCLAWMRLRRESDILGMTFSSTGAAYRGNHLLAPCRDDRCQAAPPPGSCQPVHPSGLRA